MLAYMYLLFLNRVTKIYWYILVFQCSIFITSVNIFFNSKIFGRKVLSVAYVTKQILDVNYAKNINQENINNVPGMVNYIVMKLKFKIHLFNEHR